MLRKSDFFLHAQVDLLQRIRFSLSLGENLQAKKCIKISTHGKESLFVYEESIAVCQIYIWNKKYIKRSW